MNYFKLMECNEIFYSDSGSPVKETFRGKIIKDGSIELVFTGVINTDDEIESYRKDCELATLISRYENGDLLALNSRSGWYGDATAYPGNLADAMNIVLNAESEFNKLSIDTKKQFDSDWRKWLAQFGSAEWLKSMNIEFSDVEKESEVKSDAEEK